MNLELGRKDLSLFLLPFLCLLVYLPALQNGFVFDDFFLVVRNPYIKSWKHLPEMVTGDVWNVWEAHNYWRPIFSLSLALDYSLWGLNPVGFHLSNIIVHTTSTLLLYSLGKKLGNSTCAVLAALLFGLHPIQAQAVNVISIRADLLAALFSVLSLQALLYKRTILFAIALALALLSKETSMAMPFALVFAWLIVERQKWSSALPGAFGVLAFYLVARLSLGFSFVLPRLIFSYEASVVERVLLAFKVLALYFLAIVSLFEMPRPFWTTAVPGSITEPGVISGIVIFVVLIGIIGRSWRRVPIVAFGCLWFIVYFLPISNLKELNQPVAEHWVYLPMIGLSLALGKGIEALSSLLPERHPARAGIMAGIVVFLIFAALVVREKTRIYQDNETFLLATIRANPRVAGLYRILGNTYLGMGDSARAKEFYTKALDLDPEDLFANERLGFVLQKSKQPEEATIYLRTATRYNPIRLAEIMTVAHAWELLGDKQKALSFYRKALALDSRSVRIKEKVASLETPEARPIAPNAP